MALLHQLKGGVRNAVCAHNPVPRVAVHLQQNSFAVLSMMGFKTVTVTGSAASYRAGCRYKLEPRHVLSATRLLSACSIKYTLRGHRDIMNSLGTVHAAVSKLTSRRAAHDEFSRTLKVQQKKSDSEPRPLHRRRELQRIENCVSPPETGSCPAPSAARAPGEKERRQSFFVCRRDLSEPCVLRPQQRHRSKLARPPSERNTILCPLVSSESFDRGATRSSAFCSNQDGVLEVTVRP